MAVKTSNIHGRITVSDDAVAMVASFAAMECYGVVDLVSRRLTDSIAELFGKSPYGRGIRVTSDDNKIFIDVFAIVKHGISKEAVSESLKSLVAYSVESFTGMRVMEVNVNIVGVRV